MVASLPVGHVRVVIGGRTYYRYGTTYYLPSSRDDGPVYVVTAAPAGAVVDELPAGHSVVQADGGTYFVAAGVFYRVKSYEVVPPPTGARLSRLPADHKTVEIDGVSYHVADGVHYLPQEADGETRYVVAAVPE